MELSYEAALAVARKLPGGAPRITRIADPDRLPPAVTRTGSGFFDPAHPARPLDVIRFSRTLDRGDEVFVLDSRIGYRDKQLGVFLVPDPGKPFKTDFASIPQIFTWLVPKSGLHLPAALLHDGLVPPRDETYVGPSVARQQADRIFRDAMRDLGTGGIRRWLVWTAVVFATDVDRGASDGAWKTRRGLRVLALPALFVLAILVLGTMATIDLFDRAQIVPWMGTSSTAYELLAGGFFAVAIPAVLSLLFYGRQMVRAALILGVAMAVFLHATVVLWVLLLAYNSAEATVAAARRQGDWRAAGTWGAALAATLVGLLGLVKLALAVPRRWADWSFEVGFARRAADAVGRFGLDVWRLSGVLYLVAFAGLVALFAWSAHRADVAGRAEAVGAMTTPAGAGPGA